jgi:hypothetical protein
MYDKQDFWIGLVEESIELDWSEAFVPLESLPVEVAVALAERLNLEIDVDVSEYVFYQSRSRASKVRESRVVH